MAFRKQTGGRKASTHRPHESELVALTAALDYLLDNHDAHIPVLKNRLREPADGYVDVLVNVWIGEHLCEVQLHLARVKGEGGHGAYKWFRRLLQDDDVYEGEVDAEGEPHGKGTMKYAVGDRYEGEWKAGEKDGVLATLSQRFASLRVRQTTV